MDIDTISKQKDNMNKTTKIGLMGVRSNYHEHKNNQDYNFFLTKTETRTCLILNPYHEQEKQE
jgi:hypothetical protein